MSATLSLLASARRRNSGFDGAANLAVRWRMDETSGNVLATSHTANWSPDSTVVANIIEISTGYPSATPNRTTGVYGNGVLCSVSGGGQFVRAGNGGFSGDSAYALDNANEMTMGIWVKPFARSATGKWSVLLHTGRSDGYNNGCKVEIIAWTDGLVYIHIWGYAPATTFTLPLNEWTHVMFSRVRSTRVIKLYFNGILNTTYTMPVINQDGFATFCAGNSNSGLGSGYSSKFDGALDDFRIYNRVLLDWEIASIAAGTDLQTP
jgi:hypothetical protein